MWRSKGKDLILKCSKQALPKIQNQVPYKIPTPFPHSSKHLFNNYKFFSTHANLIAQNDVEDENPDIILEENGESNKWVGSVVVKQKVFEETPERTNEKVVKVVSALRNASLAVNGFLESSLGKLELTVNEEFMVRVIETPLVPGESLIRFFKWAWKKTEFSMTAQVVDCLLKVIGNGQRKIEIYSLWDLVKKIGKEEKSLLSSESLNHLISLFWRSGKGKAGLEVFNKFEEFGCEPNANSYYFTIEALYRRSIFDKAWVVCEKMLTAGKLPDDIKEIGNLIACFCKGNMTKEAHLVYLKAKEKKKRLPHFSIKLLVSSLCKENDTVKLALDLLDDFNESGRKYAIKHYSGVIRGLLRIKDIEAAKTLLFKMIDEGPPPGNAVFNSVINVLCKAGRMEEARDLVKVMENRGLRPDVYTYCVIMSGYAKKGLMEEAQNVFSEAKNTHSILSPVTYHVLTRGYCKIEEFDKALKLFNEMKESGLKPNADEYNKMIQSLCLEAFDWRTAEKLLEEMKENDLRVDGITRDLITAVKELEEHKVNAEKEFEIE